MAIKLGHVLAGFLVFAVLTVLFSEAYAGFTEAYNITPTDTRDGQTIMEKLDSIVLISGMQETVDSIFNIVNPSNAFDVVGGFLAIGIGVFKIASGLISFPVEIIGVVTGFYYIPPVVAQALSIIFMIYLGMMLLNKSTGGND
jgi:hypothetical protein